MNNIIACGVPRSGSTLIWQILLRALPGKEVVKAHPASWTPIPCQFIVGSIRHPYDNAASCYRSRIVGDNGDGSQETVRGTKKGLIAELRMLTNNYRVLKELMLTGKVAVLRYEDFYNNFDIVFDMIQRRLGIIVPDKRREEIEEDCSFEKNQQRSFSGTRKDYKRNKINNSHVGNGVPGTWKAIIPLWGYDVMKKWCDPLCEEWDYESQ